MKLYHCQGGFTLCDVLADYLKSIGRSIPASLLSGVPPAEDRNPYGKPYFTEAEFEGIFFSRSDTKGCKTIGFSDNEIGVDCENTKERPGIRFQAIAKRCFTEDELEYLDSEAAGATERFFELWTAKEAYMKYTGKGFAEEFRSFSVFRLPDVGIETGRVKDMPHIVYSVCTERVPR